MKIIVNKARCRTCGEVIVADPHDANENRFCKCGAIAVGGGCHFIHRLGHHRDIEELSVKEY